MGNSEYLLNKDGGDSSEKENRDFFLQKLYQRRVLKIYFLHVQPLSHIDKLLCLKSCCFKIAQIIYLGVSKMIFSIETCKADQ